MPPKPFAHQLRAAYACAEAYREGVRRMAIVIPTGGGKTFTAVLIVQSGIRKGRRVLWLAHREELIDQAVAPLRALGLRVGVVKAGREADPAAPMQVASVQTLVARPQSLPPCDILVLDEVHHYVADTYAAVVGRYPSLELLLGLTATPGRLDGKGLGKANGGILERLIVAATVRELQSVIRPDGYPVLVPVTVYGPAKRQRELWMPPLDALRKFARRAEGSWRPTILFAESVDEAARIAAASASIGMRAAAIDGKTSSRVRADAIERFARGELDMLTNVAVLTEGFDAPRTEVVAIMRGVSGVGPLYQMIGRGTRANPDTRKQRCIVLDGRGVSNELGLIDDEIEYSLDGEGMRRTATEPLAQCPSCARVFRPTDDRRCPSCSMPLTVRRRTPERGRVRPAETIEITAEHRAAQRERQVKALRTILGRAAAAAARGKPWQSTAIGMQFRGLFGFFPNKELLDRAKEGES